MKVSRISTIGLPLGIRVMQYEDADIKKALETPTNLPIVTDIVNKYLRQKDALVEFRDDLVTALKETIKFPMPTETVKEDGKDVVQDALKPAQYFDLFIASLVSGEFKHARFPITGANPAEKEKSAYAAFQAFADTLGNVDEKGQKITVVDGKPSGTRFAYLLDIARPERAPSKAAKIPEYAINGATNIINNGAEAKWAEKFTKGFKDANGFNIQPIAFEPFNAKAPAGANAATVEAVRKSNIENLARAIVEKEAQVRKLREEKTTAEFA